MNLRKKQNIREMWTDSSLDMQKVLVRNYLEKYGTSSTGHWQEFLAAEFCIDEEIEIRPGTIEGNVSARAAM